MKSKLEAAEIALSAGIPMVLTHGSDPAVLYSVLDGSARGTYFTPERDV